MMIIGPGHTDLHHLLGHIPQKDGIEVVIVEKAEEPKLPPEDFILNFRPPVIEDGYIPKLSSPKDYGYVRANRRH
jgi:hypothetical protein